MHSLFGIYEDKLLLPLLQSELLSPFCFLSDYPYFQSLFQPDAQRIP